MKLVKFLFLSVFYTLCLQVVFAQNGTVRGVLIDAKTNLPLDYATVFVLNVDTKASVRAAQTDSLGVFQLINVPFGTYTFKASNLGYETLEKPAFVNVNSDKPSLDLGVFPMTASKSQLLSEVTVVGEKKQMQLDIDKKVFSVDQSLVSEGGSATDLLQNVPSIQTDVDGNISLRGASPQVLINGKPSTIGGGDVAQMLQAIPAGSIEKVEVITNPSSRYDAAGQSGIVNIVLKKNAKLGLSGSVTLGVGNRQNNNEGIDIAFQNNKWNFYGNYNTRAGNRFGYGYNNRTDLTTSDPNTLRFINQNSSEIDKGRDHNVVLGMDYNLTDKILLGISGGYNLRNNTEDETIDFDYLTTNNSLLNINQRVNNETSKGSNYFVNFDAMHKFKKAGEELSFNFNYGWGDRNEGQYYATNYFDAQRQATGQTPDQLMTNSTNNSKNYNIQLDYVLPVENGKFEAGARTQIQDNDRGFLADSTFNNAPSVFAYEISNLFSSTNQVHAVYSNFQKNYGNFGVQLGLRLEKADLTTNLGAYDASSNLSYTQGGVHYTRLFPSIYLSQKIGDQSQLQLSYTRRVERPNPRFINPFKNVSDPINIRQGNPNLLPEDIHAFELGYSKNWKNVNFISSLYYRLTNDVVQFVRTIDAEGISTSMPLNFTKASNTGLELISQVTVNKFWNFNANTNFYQVNVQGSSDFGNVNANNSGFSWNANLTNNFKLPANISLQLRADYRSPEVTVQGKRREMFGVDLGAKYAFWKNKASLSFNMRDVFKTRRFGMMTESPSFLLDFQRYRLGQQAMLTFTYNFGMTNLFKKEKKSGGGNDSQGGGMEDMSPM